jgi:hypothetical protein
MYTDATDKTDFHRFKYSFIKNEFKFMIKNSQNLYSQFNSIKENPEFKKIIVALTTH